MKITKYEHSCLVVENSDRTLVIDPGEYSTSFQPGNNIDAVIVTHEHGDHFDPEKISSIVNLNPDAVIFTTAKVAEELRSKATLPNNQIIVAENGQKVQREPFDFEFFGHDHAEIVEGVVPCDNIGVVVNNALVYGGDSFAQPPVQPKILALPAVAPWLKIYESMQHVAATKPVQVFPTHNALLSPTGESIFYNWLRKACEDNGTEFIDLQPGDAVEV
ncbi:MBL fold metallo-hydrolase [Candidatus Saccharibacteria bacterium]|nr:MBL fold metallo-hydrolase [Candidatus Saccharibacteria bacterium]